ncbi:MAG: transketolase C-terminal domain-containing protein [bacterium]|nr:transketolase C-terminal domain-containing protein [bacterium]
MRTTFVKTLTELAGGDENIFFMVGDLGFGVIEDFQRKFPNQFANAGVAEQNMTGMAAGLAMSGRKVFTYSIGNFPTLRCLEQIRNDVCYHNLNVKIISVGGGFAYGALSSTHHGTEDLAIMRALPNMTVIAPADPVETILATRAVAEHIGPCYMRLNRANDPMIHLELPDFKIGKAIKLKEGKDVTIISTGGIASEVIKASEILAQQKISARVLSMHTIKPLDIEAIRLAAEDTGAIVTVEEHSKLGGLGGAIAEAILDTHINHVSFLRLGVSDEFSPVIGDQEFLRDYYGLSAVKIVSSVAEFLKRKTY